MQDKAAWPTLGLLTSDNSYLSRPKPALALGSAVNCTDLPDAVASYVRDSLAENTRRAYLSDLRHFEAWGGSLPAFPATIAAYLAAHADSLSVATLVRRLASISKAHRARGLSNPTRSELVRTTLRGIKRTRGCTQRAGQAPAPRRSAVGARHDGRWPQRHPGSRPAADRIRSRPTALRAGRARRRRYRRRPTGYRAPPTAFEDRPGRPRPEDRHPIRSDSVVSRGRA